MSKRNVLFAILTVFLFAGVFSALVKKDPAQAGADNDEIAMFVKAAKKVQAIEDNAEVEMVGVINDHGMEMERYIEIVKMDNDADTNVQETISKEEFEKYTAAKKKIDEIKKDMEQKQVEAIKSAGLDVKRYSEIAEAASEDPELSQKINAEMQK